VVDEQGAALACEREEGERARAGERRELRSVVFIEGEGKPRGGEGGGGGSPKAINGSGHYFIVDGFVDGGH
jgi:hypothetical protein